MIVENVLDLKQSQTFFLLRDFLSNGDVYLKLEGANFSGSIKMKSALKMISCLEERKQIKPGQSRIIESTSGNLGIALSIICKEKGYEFICVVDPNVSSMSISLITLNGGKIEMVTDRDENGGFLLNRIRRIEQLLEQDPSLVWTNQYANPDNTQAHYDTTAAEIFGQFPKLDFLFIGAGTTGTLGGCARFFEEKSSITTIVAVDPEGSVTFGKPSKKRYIPGLGTSRRPEITTLENVSKVVTVSEPDTIQMCHEILTEYRLFIGPSTGTILQGVRQYFNEHPTEKSQSIVAISPDFGDKYIDTVYNDAWIRSHYSDTLADQIQTRSNTTNHP
jgi:N-(2-amino-2-carboxyethyl)-L-glutamate synthase